jgi:hypothetical protein
MSVRVPIDTDPAPFNVATSYWRSVKVDSKNISDVDATWDTNDGLKSASSLLKKHLFGAGISVTKKKGEYQLTDFFQREIEENWEYFGRMVIDSLMKYGFVMCGINSQRRPYVHSPRVCTIDIQEYPTGDRKYRIIDHKPQSDGRFMRFPSAKSTGFAPRDDLIVFETDAPDKTGYLCSLVQAVLSPVVLCKHFTAIHMRGMLMAAMPPMVTESSWGKMNADDEVKGIDRTEIGDLSDFITASAEAKLDAEAERMRRATERDAQSNAIFNEHFSDNKPPGEAFSGNESFVSNAYNGVARFPLYDKFRLPHIDIVPGRKLVSGPSPVLHGSIHEMQQELDRKVSAVVGVPYHLWGGDTGSSGIATNQVVLNTFHYTCIWWRKVVTRIIRTMLEACYKVENVDHIFRETYDETKSPMQNYMDNQFEVSIMGLIDPETMGALHESGMVDTANVVKPWMHNFHGLPLDFIHSEPVNPATGRPVKDAAGEEEDLNLMAKRVQILTQMVGMMMTTTEPTATSSSSSSPTTQSLAQRLEAGFSAITGGVRNLAKQLPSLTTKSQVALQSLNNTTLADNPSRKATRRNPDRTAKKTK